VGAFEDGRSEKFTEAHREKLRQDFKAMREEVDELLKGRRPFHWPLEFPEVFVVGLEEERGFSAIVSNPPFLGGQRISGPLGSDYRNFLITYMAQGKRGNADLCAYFFLRAGQLVYQYGQFALLATNTVAQGDTREVGLDQMMLAGWTIPRAVPSRKWPGAASLEVAHIWLRRGDWQGPYMLDEKPVEGITTLLTPQGAVRGKPYTLLVNVGKSFIGSYLLGTGFVLEPNEAQALIAKDSRNRDVLFPYLNGEDLNSRPDQSPSRWVINFHDWTLEHAESYPDCIKIVREKVLPQRKVGTKFARKEWWLYERERPALYNTIREMKRVLVVTIVTSYLAPAFCPTGWVYAHRCCVFPSDDWNFYSLIQSNIHESWARQYSSSLETRLNYSPSDCLETFPFPSDPRSLQNIGERYYQHRQSIMLSRCEGLTKTYNHFHDQQEMAEDIVQLRALHKEMDEAVAKAYGWDDLELEHGFHVTKQGLRYTVSEEARREVLGRLLKLNHERYAEEEALGLHEKRVKKRQGKRSIGKGNEIGKGQDGVGEQGELVFE
jgi:hypothetical protein